MTKSVTCLLTMAAIIAGATAFSCTSQVASLNASPAGPTAQTNATPKEMVPPPVAAPGTSLGTAKPSSTNFPNVPYPRIEPDGRVTFRFVARDAQKVQVSIVNQPFDM